MTRAYRRLRRERWHTKLLETLRRQPPEWSQQTLARLREAALRNGIVIYPDAKTPQPVLIHWVPWLLTPAQCRYVQLLGIRVRRVLNRVLRTYLDDPVLQAVLPLSEDERTWLAQLAPKGLPEPAIVFERLDTNLMTDDPQWPSTFRILEFNSVGIGCLHFAPSANQLIAEHVLPVLQPVLGQTPAQLPPDPRILLRRALEAHAKAIGRPHAVTAFVERRESCSGGADEMRAVSEFLNAQGFPTVYADPRDLEVRNGELMCKDTAIDLVYRDFMLSEVVSIEKHGGHLDAMKQAFSRNQVVSGLAGEFDHKSLLELCSNPEFGRCFTPSQRRTLHSFVPWTRLIYERKTTDPEGKEVDLVEYVRAHREALVLKPNRAYGGQDVVIGVDAAQAAWEAAVGNAMAEPNAWVAQAFVPLPRAEFFIPDAQLPDATMKEFVTMGFIATPDGISFVGRSFGDRIVNISRGGGLVPVFLLR